MATIKTAFDLSEHIQGREEMPANRNIPFFKIIKDSKGNKCGWFNNLPCEGEITAQEQYICSQLENGEV